jgi:hypothetical protein
VIVAVLDMSLGSAQCLSQVVLWGYSQPTNLRIFSWTDTRITVALPNDGRIGEGRISQIGLQDRSGNWVSNIGPATAGADAGALHPALPPTATKTDAKAHALADAVVKASGGAKWPKVNSIRFTFNVSQNGKLLLSAEHDWDVLAGSDTVSWSGKRVTVNVWNPGIDADAKAAYARWVNDSYWLLAPLKLRDPGVRVRWLGSDKDDALEVSFDHVGLTPGDKYVFYIQRSTRLPYAWDYMPAPNKKVSGTWDGYKNFGGLKLSTEHNFGGKRIWFSGVAVESSSH